MAKTPVGSDVTQDLSSDNTSISRVAQEFDSAWQQTLHGLPPPDLELAVAKVPEGARGALRQVLQEIVERYLKRRSAVNGPGETVLTSDSSSLGSSSADQRSASVSNVSAEATCETINLSTSAPSDHSTSSDGSSVRSRSFWERGDRKSMALAPSSDASADDNGNDFSLDPAIEAQPARRAALPTLPGYEILGVLGRGGMGVVYRARQIGLNRIVALKMILTGTHASAEQFERFRAEAEAVAQLHHPHIVQVFDVGEHDGLPFFSLEFVDGPSLEKKLDGKPQVPRYAAGLVEQLARAMQHAHDHGLVHRDLKPGNILLTKEHEPKITDFGLVKKLDNDSSQTRTGTIMGTPSYMAPEQGRGERSIGPAADVYALGSILYALLTGRPPFMAPTPLETVVQLLKQEPLPPSRLQPQIPRDLETICLKCLQKDTNNRYVCAVDLAEDLRRYQAGEPIRARRVSALERTWRWCRRNPRIASLSAAVAVLLITAGVALSYTAVHAVREREMIRDARKHTMERLEQSLGEARLGNVRRANDVLAGVMPLAHQSSALADVRDQVSQLQQQLSAFAEFHQLLDNARFHVLLGGPASYDKAREICHDWLQLATEMADAKDRGRFGWPPLDDYQRTLLEEDIFEGHLLAAKAECDAAQGTADAEQIRKATSQAIEWLNALEKRVSSQRVLHVHRASYYGMSGNTEASQADVERAMAIEPTSAVDHFWHGFADYLRGEEAKNRGDGKAAGEHYRLAIDEYARFIRVRPTNPWGYLMSANCQLALGRTHDAMINLTTSVQLSPDAPFGYNNRGVVLLMLGRNQEAFDDFTAAIERDANYAVAYTGRADVRRALEQSSDLVLADYAKAIDLNPRDQRARLARAGYCFDALHDYALARADFAALLELAPADPLGYFRHGLASMKLRDLDQALVDFQQMEQRLPNSPEAHYFQATIYLGRRHDELAAKKLQAALTLKPEYIDGLAARGHLHLRRGEHESALADANELVRLAPNNAGLLIERADVYFAIGRYDEAAADYRLCIKLDPTLIDAYVGLARSQQRQGHTNEAKQTYDQMISANSQSAIAFIRRGEYLRDQGFPADARADAQIAKNMDAVALVAPLLLASIDAAEGKAAAATAVADELVARSDSGDGNVLYAAACVWSIAAKVSMETNAEMGERYLTRSIELLSTALGPGFHDLNYQAHNRLRDDPALETIRSRPDVQSLISARSQPVADE